MSGRLPFGKYRGWPVEELPDGYLRWLLTIEITSSELWDAIVAEASRRGLLEDDARDDDRIPPERASGAPAAAIVDELVSAGVRSLARRYHPDLVGGDGARMKLVNHAADWLRQQARALA